MIFELNYREDTKIQKIYEKVFREHKKFFGFKWKNWKPKIFKLSEKTRNELTEGFFPKSASAFCKGEYVFLEEKYFGKKEELIRILRHELTHAFVWSFSGYKRVKPRWVDEGLATYLARENKNREKPQKFGIFLNSYDSIEKNAYSESGFVIGILVKKYGKQKLFKLIKSLPEIKNKTQFNRLFKKTYGFNPTYTKFNEMLGKEEK